jgi:hypothetical protein
LRWRESSGDDLVLTDFLFFLFFLLFTGVNSEYENELLSENSAIVVNRAREKADIVGGWSLNPFLGVCTTGLLESPSSHRVLGPPLTPEPSKGK